MVVEKTGYDISHVNHVFGILNDIPIVSILPAAVKFLETIHKILFHGVPYGFQLSKSYLFTYNGNEKTELEQSIYDHTHELWAARQEFEQAIGLLIPGYNIWSNEVVFKRREYQTGEQQKLREEQKINLWTVVYEADDLKDLCNEQENTISLLLEHIQELKKMIPDSTENQILKDKLKEYENNHTNRDYRKKFNNDETEKLKVELEEAKQTIIQLSEKLKSYEFEIEDIISPRTQEKTSTNTKMEIEITEHKE